MKQQHPTSERPATVAPRWRSALGALIGAPVRLHRYRHLHAEVIDDALRAFDCGPGRRAGS
jgi:hypothetical protein